MSARPESELILCCSRTRIEPETAARIRALTKTIDWALLIRAATPQGVIPLVYTALNQACREEVPTEVMHYLADVYHTNVQRNLLRLRDLLCLLDLFQAERIRVIPFKGPVLALSAYGSLGCRQFHDLDVLVHPQDVARARNLLLAQGYQLQWHAGDWEYHFTREDGDSPIDLHERIASPSFRERFAFDDLWAGLRPVPVSGRSVLSFGAPDLLLVLSLQLAKDCRGWKQRLVQICDGAELIRRSPELDWNHTIRKAAEAGSKRMLLLHLELVHALLDSPLPDTVLKEIRANPAVQTAAAQVRARLFPEIDGPSEALRYRTEIWYEDAAFYFKMRERLADKLAYLRHFVRVQLMRDRQVLRLSPSLSLLYHLLRPVRLLVDRVRERRRVRGRGAPPLPAD